LGKGDLSFYSTWAAESTADLGRGMAEGRSESGMERRDSVTIPARSAGGHYCLLIDA